MAFEKRKKGIITVFALLLAAFIAGSVFSVSAKYTTRWSSTNTYVKVEGIFKVTFDAGTNGGTIAGTTVNTKDLYAKKGESTLYSDSTATVIEQAPLAINAEMRFDGWYTAASGGEKVIDVDRSIIPSTTYTDASGKWNISSDIRLYAHYVAYKITFDAVTNGGTITGSTELYAKNGSTKLYTTKEAIIEAVIPTAEYSDAEHYYFDGWYTTDSGTDKKIGYVDNVLTVLTPFTGLTDDNTVLYAQYKPYTYVVTFDGNAPSGKTVTGATANWEKTYDEAASALSANGYSVTDNTCVFVGWMTASDGTIRQFTNEQSVTVRNLLDAGALVTADIDRTKKNITLYARWSVVHTVTFKNMTNATGTVVATYYEFDGALYTDSTLITPVEEMPSAGSGSRSGLKYWTTTKNGRVGTGSTSTPAPLVVSAGAVQERTTYTDDQGHGFTVNDMSHWTLESDITLYAVWYKINYYKDTKQIPGNSGFTELEYIESTNGGGQYINTEYIPPDDLLWFYARIKFSMMPTYLNNSNNYFYQAGNEDNKWFAFLYNSSYNAHWNTGYDWYFGDNLHKKRHSININNRYSYDVQYRYGELGTANSLIVNSNAPGASGTANWQGTLGNGNQLLFFKGIGSNYSAEKLYYLKLYSGNNDTLRRNLVPARWKGGSVRYSYQGHTSTGVLQKGTLGLYDTVSGIFFINSGSSTFLTQADYTQENLIYGEPVTIAYSPADCEYTHINDTSPFAGSLCTAWTYTMGGTGTDYVKANSYNDIYTHVSTDSTEGDVFVDLYTSPWIAPNQARAIFRSPNKSTEYVYVEPADEEDADVFEEENINE